MLLCDVIIRLCNVCIQICAFLLGIELWNYTLIGKDHPPCPLHALVWKALPAQASMCLLQLQCYPIQDTSDKMPCKILLTVLEIHQRFWTEYETYSR